jgi:hypothetical protein
MSYQDLYSRILAATDDGKRILTDLVSDKIIKGEIDKKFSIRTDDDTPSAMLCPPDPKYNDKEWHLIDFGKQGGRWSAVNYFMLCHGYNNEQFMYALNKLAEKYGVKDELNPHVNVCRIKVREATIEEKNQPPHIEFYDGFDGIDLRRIFVSKVKAEHMEAYGWKAVKRITQINKDGKFIEVTADPATYPIFAEECHHTDEQGNDYISHYKIYEPFNPKKEYRFSSIGDVPADYMYGRDHLLRIWRKGGEEKLPVVLVVSGGSDAVCALAYGYPAIWFNSETRQLKADELKWLQKYCDRVIYVADIDSTGIVQGTIVALSHPTLFTAWINPKELGGLHDARGNLRKDLKDYLTLHPLQKDMDRLVQSAKCAQFWIETKDEKSGKVTLKISETYLIYFLGLHGFCQLYDDSEQKPKYAFIKDNIVKSVEWKTIHYFLQEWCDREGVSRDLQDLLLKSCRTMITSTTGHLKIRDDLDFTSAFPTSQLLPFENGIVTITAKGISFQAHTAIPNGHYTWEDSVIRHKYRSFKPMFTWKKDENGRYIITFADDAPSKLMHVVRNMARLHWRKKDEMGQELTEEEAAEEMQALVVIMLMIGYLLHRHKSPSAAYAPLLLDYVIGKSAKERNGRSGKTFLLKAVGALLKMAYIDMSNLSKKNNQQFGFSGVKDSTGLVVVDECPEDFAYNELYAKISDDMEIEKKGKDPVVIPFSKAPKFGIATNHTLKDHSPSTEGRFAPVVVSDYYHVMTKLNDYRETRQISDEYNQNLLDTEYAETDWQADTHFMLECLQMYLSLPVADRRQMPPIKNIEKRELQASISDSFRQWADENLGEGCEWLDRKVRSDELLNAYNQDTRFNCSPKTFTEQLKKWCQYAEHIHCYNPASCTGQKKDGDRWQVREGDKRVNYYYLQTKAAIEAACDSEPTQTDLFSSTEDVPF